MKKDGDFLEIEYKYLKIMILIPPVNITILNKVVVLMDGIILI